MSILSIRSVSDHSTHIKWRKQITLYSDSLIWPCIKPGSSIIILVIPKILINKPCCESEKRCWCLNSTHSLWLEVKKNLEVKKFLCSRNPHRILYLLKNLRKKTHTKLSLKSLSHLVLWLFFHKVQWIIVLQNNYLSMLK